MTTEPAEDGQHRCRWCLATPLYVNYHDLEWGFPVGSDQRLFEKLCLEGFVSAAHTEEDIDRTIEAAKEVFKTL